MQRAPLYRLSCKSACTAWHWHWHCWLPKTALQQPPNPLLRPVPWQVWKQHHLLWKRLISSGEQKLRTQHSYLDRRKAVSGALRRNWSHSCLWCPKGDIQAEAAALGFSDNRARQETWPHMRQQHTGPGSGGHAMVTCGYSVPCPHPCATWHQTAWGQSLTPHPSLGTAPLGKLHVLHNSRQLPR